MLHYGREGQPRRAAFFNATRVAAPATKGFLMSTERQIAASWENGRQSHGAISPERAALIANANPDTGIFAESQILGWEFQEDLEELAIRPPRPRRDASSTGSSSASGPCAASPGRRCPLAGPRPRLHPSRLPRRPQGTRTPRNPRPGRRRRHLRPRLACNPFTRNSVTSSWESP